MTPFVVGTRDDVAGFALAGVQGTVCTTRADIDAALARLGDDVLVIFSAALSTSLPERMAQMHVVLPAEVSDADDRQR